MLSISDSMHFYGRVQWPNTEEMTYPSRRFERRSSAVPKPESRLSRDIVLFQDLCSVRLTSSVRPSGILVH